MTSKPAARASSRKPPAPLPKSSRRRRGARAVETTDDSHHVVVVDLGKRLNRGPLCGERLVDVPLQAVGVGEPRDCGRRRRSTGSARS